MWTDLFADLTDPESPRRILYGAVLLALIAALLLAFSAVCGEQVRRAQERDASLQMRRTAVSDCLEYAPKATRSGCLRRATSEASDAQPPSLGYPLDMAYR